VIVSGRGNIDLTRAIFHAPGINVLVITTERGKEKLALQGSDRLASTTVRLLQASNENIESSPMLELLNREHHVKLLLHEGGPTLFGRFVSAGHVDDLFLTLSPQIAGRQAQPRRPALIERVAFTPATAPWLSLLSVKQVGSHLYLHYRSSTLHQNS
jgi:riboflavin biosynthesis pyrimidine reductase